MTTTTLRIVKQGTAVLDGTTLLNLDAPGVELDNTVSGIVVVTIPNSVSFGLLDLGAISGISTERAFSIAQLSMASAGGAYTTGDIVERVTPTAGAVSNRDTIYDLDVVAGEGGGSPTRSRQVFMPGFLIAFTTVTAGDHVISLLVKNVADEDLIATITNTTGGAAIASDVTAPGTLTDNKVVVGDGGVAIKTVDNVDIQGNTIAHTNPAAASTTNTVVYSTFLNTNSGLEEAIRIESFVTDLALRDAELIFYTLISGLLQPVLHIGDKEIFLQPPSGENRTILLTATNFLTGASADVLRLLVTDTGAGSDPILTMRYPYGRTVSYTNSGVRYADQFVGTEHESDYSNTATIVRSLAASVATGDITERIYGLGNAAATDQEFFDLGWDASASSYFLKTDSAGTGTKRSIELQDTQVDQTPFNLDVLDTTANVNLNAIEQVVVSNNLAYTVSFSAGTIQVYDVSDPANLDVVGSGIREFSSIPITSFAVNPLNLSVTVVTFGAAFEVIPEGGEVTLSGQTSTNVAYTGTFIVSNVSTEGTFSFEIPVAFVGDSGTLGVYSDKDILGGTASVINGSILYAAFTTSNRVVIWDATDPQRLNQIGNIDTGVTSPTCLLLEGNLLYVICESTTDRISVYDVSDPAFPKFLSRTTLANTYRWADVQNGIVYTGTITGNRIELWDFRDPTSPTLLSSVTDATNISRPTGIVVRGRFLYVVDQTLGTLSVWDVNDIDSAPIFNNRLTGFSSPYHLEVIGDYAFMSERGGSGGLAIIDKTVPTALLLVRQTTLSGSGQMTRFAFNGDVLVSGFTNTDRIGTYSMRGFRTYAASIGTLKANEIKATQLAVEGSATVGSSLAVAGSVGISGPGSTIQGRALFGTPNDVIFVSEASGLPAADAGVITLRANTHYVFYSPTPGTRHIIDVSDRIEFADEGTTVLSSTGTGVTLLQYTGSGVFFTTSPTFRGVVNFENMVISAPAGTLFDIDATLPVGAEGQVRLNIKNGVGFFNVAALGTIRTLSFGMSGPSSFQSVTTGLTLDHVREAFFESVRFQTWANAAGSKMISLQHDIDFPKVQNCTFDLGSNEVVFDISPSITKEVLISGNSVNGGLGVFDTTGLSGSVSSSAAGTTGVSGVISGAEVSVGNETVFTDALHGLSLWQFITIAGTTSYNGLHQVIEVIDTSTFRVHVAFVADESGTWTSDMTTVTTSAAHGLTSLDGVAIANTFEFDGNHTIFNASGSVFDVNVAFTSSPSTGDWTTNSLDKTDNGVRAIGNAGIVDSTVVGGVTVNGNASAMVISAADTYTLINVVGSPGVLVSNAERFELGSSVVATCTYFGDDPFNGELVAVITGFKAGATETYRFTVGLNLVVPSPSQTPYAPLEVKTTIDTTTLIFPISLIKSDNVRIYVQGVGTSDNPTIQDITYVIR